MKIYQMAMSFDNVQLTYFLKSVVPTRFKDYQNPELGYTTTSGKPEEWRSYVIVQYATRIKLS